MNAVAEPNMPTTADELDRLELLREFKRLFAGDGKSNRSPFTDERVVRLDADVKPWDVPEIHRPVREAIEESIRELHHGKFSKVVILAGENGMGKSHILNHFRSPELEKELGYVFVGSNNFWKVEEFESFLLMWLVTALTRPTPDGEDLLLKQVKEIAFEALDQILDQPGQLPRYQSGKKLGWLRRIFWNMGRDKHAMFKDAYDKRDERIFRRLDFHNFANFVSDRFLADKSNPFHRFVVHVLLRYLFPEDRRKVCAWLVGQKLRDAFFDSLGGPYKTRDTEPGDPHWRPSEEAIEAHFQKEIGISDSLNLNFKLMDTVKILVSLFAPDVVRGLKGQAEQGRIFVFAFDQAEGRNELFESEKDWFKFFAKLAEIYNSLPNVFVVFTMTSALRNQLYPKMEKQFQQRISRDQKFVLREISDTDILALYRRQIACWMGDHISEESRERLKAPQFEFHPFSQEQVLGMAKQKGIREILQEFDAAFRATMLESPPDEARRDYLIAINEFRRDEARAANAFAYSADHIEELARFFERNPGAVSDGFSANLSAVQRLQLPSGAVAVQLELRSPAAPQRWVRVFVTRLGFNIASRLPECQELLKNRVRNQNLLWILRPTKVQDAWAAERPDQIFPRVLEDAEHTRIRAMHALLDKQEALSGPSGMTAESKDSYRDDVRKIIVEEIKLTYLGELLQHAAETLDRFGEGATNGDQ